MCNARALCECTVGGLLRALCQRIFRRVHGRSYVPAAGLHVLAAEAASEILDSILFKKIINRFKSLFKLLVNPPTTPALAHLLNDVVRSRLTCSSAQLRANSHRYIGMPLHMNACQLVPSTVATKCFIYFHFPILPSYFSFHFFPHRRGCSSDSG